MSDVLNPDGTPIDGGLAFHGSVQMPAEAMAALAARQEMFDEWNRCAALYDQVLAGTLIGDTLASTLASDSSFETYYLNRTASGS